MRPAQLVLPLPHEPSQLRADYIVSEANRHALHLIETWPQGWLSQAILLIGPAGSGKSHLAAIWGQVSKARVLDRPLLNASAVAGEGEGAAFVIENCDDGVDETEFFYLLNSVHTRRHWLLITARQAPSQWGLQLPDVSSRLSNFPWIELGPPDDTLLSAVLTKLFSDRQIVVEPSLIRYLVARMERSLAAAGALVECLDRFALSQGRRLSRPLIAQWLAENRPESEEA